MSWFGEEINQDIMKESEANDFDAIESGIYKAEIQNAYIVGSSGTRKSDGQPKESKGLVVKFKLENGRIHDETLWFKSEFGKTTYMDKKTNKPKYLPSFLDMGYLFSACGVDINAVQPVTKTVKHFGNDIQAGVFNELLGKRIEIGIRKKLQDVYNDETNSEEANEVGYYGTLEGKSGKEVRDGAAPAAKASWLKMIAKSPVKDARKKSKGDVPSEPTEEATAALNGW